MLLPQVNYLAVLVAGIVLFLLGGLWYSPALFAKPWISLQGRTEEQMKADAARSNMPVMYMIAFICGLIISWAMAVLGNSLSPGAVTTGGSWIWRGVKLGVFCWFGFVLPTTYLTSMFSMKPKQLWAIEAGYNLVGFILAGAILMGWTGMAH